MTAGLLQRLVRGGLLLVLILAPTQYSIEVGDKTYISIVDPVIWIVFALWGLGILVSKDWRTSVTPPLYVVLLIVWASISCVQATDRMTAFKEVFQLIEYFVVAYLLFRHDARTERGLQRVARTVLIMGCLIVYYGLIQYNLRTVESFDIGATFGNRNVYGGYLSLMLPLIYGLALYQPGRGLRAFLLTTVAIGLGVTMSGATFLAVSIALGLLSIMRGPRAALLYAVALILACTLMLPRLTRENAEVLMESISLYPDDVAVAGRYTEWQAAGYMMIENPWVGVGAGNYQKNIGQYYGVLPDPTGAAEPDIQNLYLVLGSSMGLPGLLIFVAILLCGIQRATIVAARSHDLYTKALATGLLGAVLAFAINALWAPLLVRGIGIPLVVILCLIDVLRARLPNN